MQESNLIVHRKAMRRLALVFIAINKSQKSWFRFKLPKQNKGHTEFMDELRRLSSVPEEGDVQTMCAAEGS